MSDPTLPAAGWYPDPSDAAAQRWWDGARWTEHVAPAAPVAPAQEVPVVPVVPVAPVAPVTPGYAPAYPAAPAYGAGQPAPYGGVETPRMPAGTPVDTVWIWLIVALPVLAVLPLFLWDFQGYLEQSMSISASTSPMANALGPYTDPWYLVLTFGSWVLYGLAVWFAYLDYAALAKLGYPRRFHWAWTFLSSLVYVIGRSVVVRRQAGRGYLPMAVGIALTVVLAIGVIVWVVVVMVAAVNTSMELMSTYSY
ncbi:DUF2510 domain-containing protein [Agromyces sp. NPDC055520]